MEKPRMGRLLGETDARKRLAEAEARGEARERHAGGLRHERDRARGARVHLEDEELAAADRELDVHEAHDLERQPELGRGLPDFAERRARHAPVRRQHGVRIARMDARLFDVLHDPGDDDVLSVAERVDVELVGILEKPVDQDGPVRKSGDGLLEHRLEGVLVVGDAHRAASEHVARANEKREAEPAAHFEALGDVARGAPRRSLQVHVTQQLAEALAVLGAVDRVRRGAENRDAGGLERLRELQRRLAAELHENPLGLFASHDREDVFERERLEVEPVGRVVVRRDRLGVAVDHH